MVKRKVQVLLDSDSDSDSSSSDLDNVCISYNFWLECDFVRF